MKRVNVVAAQQSHVAALANKMKQSDIDECMASHLMEPFDALTYSLKNSIRAFTVLVNGKPEMMFGVCPGADGMWVIWMLSTEQAFGHITRKRFMRECRQFISRFHDEFGTLYNHVDERNLKSLSWLRRLGFKLKDRIPEYGAMGMPFIRVESRG